MSSDGVPRKRNTVTVGSPRAPITQQGVRCPHCAEEIFSNERHDFVACKCKKTYIDGGFDYIRVGYDSIRPEHITRTLSEKPKTRFREERR